MIVIPARAVGGGGAGAVLSPTVPDSQDFVRPVYVIPNIKGLDEGSADETNMKVGIAARLNKILGDPSRVKQVDRKYDDDNICEGVRPCDVVIVTKDSDGHSYPVSVNCSAKGILLLDTLHPATHATPQFVGRMVADLLLYHNGDEHNR